MSILRIVKRCGIIVLSLFVLLVVCYFFSKNNPIIEFVELKKEPPSTLIINLCNFGGEKYHQQTNERFSPIVKKCGDYFLVYPSRFIMDAPVVYVNAKGAVVATCGGMPSPNPVAPDPVCDTSCDEQNLCIGVVLDCSEITSDYFYESCLCENYVRTGEKKYLEKITKTDLKDRCPAIKNYSR